MDKETDGEEIIMERKISKTGSITIPKSMRRELGIDGKEKVNLKPQNNGSILIDRIEGTCIFCSNTDNVEAFKGKFVCSECRKELAGE